jgi:nucleotide-binding universal stress UspA family protein
MVIQRHWTSAFGMVSTMRTLRPLVCGTDFSEDAERAFQLAVEFALVAHTQVVLVHVCQLDADTVDELRLSRCHEALSAVIERHRHRGVDVTAVLRSGIPWEKLDNVAADVGASLIVIGRRGAGDRDVALGSVADQLLRTASRPVLTVLNELIDLDSEAPETNRK